METLLQLSLATHQVAIRQTRNAEETILLSQVLDQVVMSTVVALMVCSHTTDRQARVRHDPFSTELI